MNHVLYLGSAFLVLISIFVIFRVIVRLDYKRKGGLTFWSVASEWLLILIWVFFTNSFLPADWPMIHVVILLQVIGWICILSGVGIFFGSFAWLGLQRSHGLKADKIMQSGPYRFTRNPQIVGFCLSMIGFTILWPTWYVLGSLLLLFVFSHAMVITEEEHLLDVHGDKYKQYCKLVPRYVGIPRKRLQST